MAIMSEGLPQKLKCIKMGHLSLSFDGYPFMIMILQP